MVESLRKKHGNTVVSADVLNEECGGPLIYYQKSHLTSSCATCTLTLSCFFSLIMFVF